MKLSQAKLGSAIEVAVVGHTNVGKTSLLRTLTRQQGFGDVSDSPGTTRHVERIDLRVDGEPAVRFYDTPGLEDAVALQHFLQSLPGAFDNPVERVRAFLAGPEAHAAFEQEAKVLRKMLEVDAAIYVIDCRQELLPKYRSEIAMLCACARPVMPVLNFMAAAGERVRAWRELLAGFNLHIVMEFDAVAPFVGAEGQLFHDLSVLLRERQDQLQAVVAYLARQGRERRTAAVTLAARLLVHAAAQRVTVASNALQSPEDLRADAVQSLRQNLGKNMQACVQAVLGVYGFRPGDADVQLVSWTSGRWEHDLFNPELLQDAGRKLGTGAAVGAAIGFGADVALAGMSLGAATALGAALGGVASQGWSQLPRKLSNKLQGVDELTLEDAVLLALADSLLTLIMALERRGHAASARLDLSAAAAGVPVAVEDTTTTAESDDRRALRQVVRALRPARGLPPAQGANAIASNQGARREALIEQVALPMLQALQLRTQDATSEANQA